MNRSVIERLVVEHGKASDFELPYISDHDLAVLAMIVHRECEAGKAGNDSVKLIVSCIIITISLIVLQPLINGFLLWFVQHTNALVGLAFVCLPCVVLIVLSTFHK